MQANEIQLKIRPKKNTYLKVRVTFSIILTSIRLLMPSKSFFTDLSWQALC